MTVKKIYSQELIGRTIEVIHSPNRSLEGIKGKVIDETKATLRINSFGNSEKTRTLLKGSITFRVLGAGIVIRGRDIIRRPEERVKG